jgi:glyoxylase-like metal-dependent hydrolase (beta-lactamase superfamily II)
MTTTKLRIASLIAAVVLTSPAFAQETDFSAASIETQEVADGLYMLMLVGAGAGNIALSVGDDGAVIVDTQFAPLNEKIRAAIRQAGGGDVKFVVNTHWHGDHAGGNEPFGNADAVIIAHNNVRTRMSTEQVMTAFGAPQTIPPSPAAALPVLTFPNRATFHWNGNRVNVYHAPNAHTDGDSIIHFTDLNAFHMGDTFVNGGYPFIDNGSNGSIDGIIAAGESVLARSDENTKIIPGHGALATPDDLRAFLNVVSTTRERIQTLIDQGRSLDDVIAAKPTAEWDATFGAGFMNGETFTRFAYQDLTE